MLQWGRGLGTAERQKETEGAGETAGFNGAAVLGPRRVRGAHRCSLLENTASMGPRSWARGEPRATRTALPVSQLQWGRGLGTAEREERAPLRTGIAELQWGRGLGTAERRRITAPLREVFDASMGPRSWDRGEEEIALSKHAAARLQWGRGLGTAERTSVASDPLPPG